MSLAMLGMYDMPHAQAANDRFWQRISAQIPGAPDRLTRNMGFADIWRSTDLLFAQTCGMPYRTQLHQDVTLIGTPDYNLPGCAPGYYCSVLVTAGDNLDDLSNFRMAFNDGGSQSGWAAPITHLAELNMRPSQLIQTGAHRASALAVASGHADLAAIDYLTWLMMTKQDPSTFAGLKIVAKTAPTPGLPYITSLKNDPSVLARATARAIADLDTSDREILHLNDLVHISPNTYLAVPTPKSPLQMGLPLSQLAA